MAFLIPPWPWREVHIPMATATATAALDILTIGEIAERAGAPTWAVRKTLDAIGLGKRIGPSMRVIDAADMPLVLDELERRGYLPEPGEARGDGPR